MIVVKKKMKKPLIIAILAAVLAVSVTVAIVLSVLLKNSGEPTPEPKPEYELMAGEAIYNGQPVAYPGVKEERMEIIEVKGESTYSFTRLESVLDAETAKDLSPFVLSYIDEKGVQQVYAPEIMAEDPTVTYDDFYAFDKTDALGSSMNIYKLTWLCTAIGVTYFDERIPVSENLDQRNEELKHYGLSLEDRPIEITFCYYDENDEIQINVIKVGSRIIHDGGYYFTVGNRPYVYSTTHPYLEYAFMSFTDYIEPLLVAEGLPQDNAFEPYLTTDFKQWKNTMYSEEGTAVKDGSVVAFTANQHVSAFTVNGKGEVVYNRYTDEDMPFSINIAELALNPAYKRVADALRSAKIGVFPSAVGATVYSFSTPVTLDASGVSKPYTYTIKTIESVLTDEGEMSEEGTPVGNNSLIKVTYAWYIDGIDVARDDFSGVLDLGDPAIPEDARAKLKAAKVGSLGADGFVDINITYDKTNTKHHEVAIIITDIIEIQDKDGKKLEKVEEGAKVLFRYKTVANGEMSEGSTTTYLEISDKMTDDEKAIANLLMGKACASDLEIEADVYSIDCEIIGGYTTYEITSVEYFYTRELIVSFEFSQASERDAYFGESLYKNTMDDAIYALNASSCQAVVKLLGGLNTSATNSLGLKGTETVDIGITPSKIQKYGLYANTIYFELPRGISSIDYGDIPSDAFFSRLDDYSYYDTLGFTLYISDPQIDGTRYIASDLYDVISKVNSDDFVFLDETFESFYARRNLVLVDISAIEDITLEFTMDDIYGTFRNDLVHKDTYAYGGSLWLKEELTEEEFAQASLYDSINVLVTPSGNCLDTEFSKYLTQNGRTYDSLMNFFGKKEFIGLDSAGTSSFKEFIEVLFYTHYQGALTEEQIEDGFKNGVRLMKMTVELYEDYGPYRYAYEFYKISDRRIMVKVWRENKDNLDRNSEASSFYVSTYAFEKLVGLYVDLLNGERIENETPFVDIK